MNKISNNLSFIIDIDIALEEPEPELPKLEIIEQWMRHTISKFQNNAEISLRVVDHKEMQALNNRYRHKDSPTNVLAFPADLPKGVQLEHHLLGDIVIASDIVKKEASEQNKSYHAHFAHMVVHGILHLLGFDHKNNQEAEIMENHEVKILHDLNFANPYKS